MPWGFAAAGAASGIAGGVASSAGGKKGSKQSRASEGISQEQAQTARVARELALEQAGLTKPLRSLTTGALERFTRTGDVPTFLDLPTTVAPTAQLATLSQPGIAAQQATMRRSLLNAGVRGGMIQQGLAQGAIQSGLQRTGIQQQLEMNDILRQESRDVDRARLRQTLFGAASDLGIGGLSQGQQGVGQALSGLGGAAGNLNSLGQQQIMQQMQTQQALGSIAGKGIGYGAGQYLPAYGSGTLGAQKAGGSPRGGVM